MLKMLTGVGESAVIEAVREIVCPSRNNTESRDLIHRRSHGQYGSLNMSSVHSTHGHLAWCLASRCKFVYNKISSLMASIRVPNADCVDARVTVLRSHS
jgi:hypothetical protein